MELAKITKHSLDISAEVELFSYTYDGAETKEVIARINLGDDSGPIAGGVQYVLKPAINDVVVSPAATVTVIAGTAKTVLVSRPIPIEHGDVLSLLVTGAPDDTDINAVISIRDVTPLRADEIAGAGSVAVDHNYGGDDSLTIMTRLSQRIDNATVLAYRRDDYLAGRRTKDYVVGKAVTTVSGEWAAPIMLDPGEYTLLVYKQGVIESKSINITVT